MKATQMLTAIITGLAVLDEVPGSSSFQNAHPNRRTMPTGRAARVWYANTNGNVPAIAQHNGFEKRLVLADKRITKAPAQTIHAKAAQITSSKKMRQVGGIPMTRV